MREAEVRDKFDEIVDFSEVEQFIDTPVKFYSSGMRVRLAFAVASYLEPEVLLIDEVLSVGDVTFRKKCMDKMRNVATNGATVLVVSHHAQVITSLCDRAIWLDHGRVVLDGPAADTMSSYLAQGMGLTAARRWQPESAPGKDIARLHAMRVADESGTTVEEVDTGERFCIEAEVEVLQPGHGIVLKNELYNGDRTHILSSLDTNNPMWSQKVFWEPGLHTLRMWIPAHFLQVDTYTVDVLLWAWEPQQKQQAYCPSTVSFHVTEKFDGSGARAGFEGNMTGVVRPMLEWDMQSNDQSADLRSADVHEVLSASAR
jgi:lipopolysaccharide transport system ATP-binding protein